MWNTRKQIAAIALTAFALLAQSGLARAETKAEVMEKAQKFMESNDTPKLCMFMAHPESEYRSIKLLSTGDVTDRSGNIIPDAFVLTYELRWRSALSGDMNWTRLAFLFMDDGTVEVRSKGTSSFFQPFSNTDLILNFVKEEIRKDPKLSREKVLMDLVDKGDAKGILGFFLRIGWSAKR
jgi:hypothetical protein